MFTDKTGTLTEGHITFDRALDARGGRDAEPHLLGLVCNEAVLDGVKAVSGNALDVALWDAADAGDDGGGARLEAGLAPAVRSRTPVDRDRRRARRDPAGWS